MSRVNIPNTPIFQFKLHVSQFKIAWYICIRSCPIFLTAMLLLYFTQAKEGRVHILYQMLKAKATHSETLSPAVPKMQTLTVPLSAIGKIIGPGGATIRSLIEEFGLINIDIAEGSEEGTVMISSLSEEKNQKATEKVQFLVEESNNFSPGGGRGGSSTKSRQSAPDPEVGKIYTGCEIMGVHPFGCFVQLYPGKEGLVHVSELDIGRVSDVEGSFKLGDKMDVKVVSLKDQKGKLRLSRKAALIEMEGQAMSEVTASDE